jgi:hypothetical protein
VRGLQGVAAGGVFMQRPRFPSCTTRRAIDTGAHLASVLPHVGHRQWTLSLPFTLAFPLINSSTASSRSAALRRPGLPLTTSMLAGSRGRGGWALTSGVFTSSRSLRARRLTTRLLPMPLGDFRGPA